MTTLADMTPEQRADCVGMWCEVTSSESYRPGEVNLMVFSGTGANTFYDEGGSFTKGTWVKGEYFRNAVLRLDLPRAWQPDGTPVQMGTETTVQSVAGIYELKGTRRRRFVGEWEEE